ncbi:MAG: hypothetical protein WDW38_003713 [Sanguina aurantia]
MGVCDGRSTSPDFRTFSRVQGPATALVVTDTDTGARSRYQRSAAFAGMSVSVPTVQRALPDWARSFELPQGIHDAGLPEWAHSAVDQIRRPVVYIPISAAVLAILAAAATRANSSSKQASSSQTPNNGNGNGNGNGNDGDEDSDYTDSGGGSGSSSSSSSSSSSWDSHGADNAVAAAQPPAAPAAAEGSPLVSSSHDFTHVQLHPAGLASDSSPHGDASVKRTQAAGGRGGGGGASLNPRTLPRHVATPLFARTQRMETPSPQPTTAPGSREADDSAATATAAAALGSMAAAAIAPTTPLSHPPADVDAHPGSASAFSSGSPTPAEATAAPAGVSDRVSNAAQRTITNPAPGRPSHPQEGATGDRSEEEEGANSMEAYIRNAIEAAADAESRSAGSGNAGTTSSRKQPAPTARATPEAAAPRTITKPVSPQGQRHPAAGNTQQQFAHLLGEAGHDSSDESSPAATAAGSVGESSTAVHTDTQAASKPSQVQPPGGAFDPDLTHDASSSPLFEIPRSARLTDGSLLFTRDLLVSVPAPPLPLSSRDEGDDAYPPPSSYLPQRQTEPPSSAPSSSPQRRNTSRPPARSPSPPPGHRDHTRDTTSFLRMEGTQQPAHSATAGGQAGAAASRQGSPAASERRFTPGTPALAATPGSTDLSVLPGTLPGTAHTSDKSGVASSQAMSASSGAAFRGLVMMSSTPPWTGQQQQQQQKDQQQQQQLGGAQSMSPSHSTNQQSRVSMPAAAPLSPYKQQSARRQQQQQQQWRRGKSMNVTGGSNGSGRHLGSGRHMGSGRHGRDSQISDSDPIVIVAACALAAGEAMTGLLGFVVRDAIPALGQLMTVPTNKPPGGTPPA